MIRLMLLAAALLATGPTPAAAQDGPGGWADYQAWLQRDARRQAQVDALDAFLARAGVKDVAPTWQLIRTATSWRRCGDPFTVPEPSLWPNIVPALVFIRDRVKPVIGAVEPVAVYRDEAMNACAKGARGSTHRRFAALDLLPVRPLSLDDLTSALCPIHAAHGPRARIGLGFYVGRRFHVDGSGFRTWGVDHRRESSPCRR